ncbi:MAG: hypothetical protein IKC32_07080 [Clostridia bacterium]|nr:hypothetical protein [Clostridia bacterium]
MTSFISERVIDAHEKEIERLSLKLSVLGGGKGRGGAAAQKDGEGSMTCLRSGCKADAREYYVGRGKSRRVGREAKGVEAELRALRYDIELHGVYFQSFGEQSYVASSAVRAAFGSESGLAYRLLSMGMAREGGFVGVFSVGGRLGLFSAGSAEEVYSLGTPLLAIDLCEHAYFYDYLFDKEDYLRAAIAHLDLSLIDKHLGEADGMS